jgi:hypothetical protein
LNETRFGPKNKSSPKNLDTFDALDNCTQNEANLLESVQEAGRIITGLRVNSSRSKLYSELGWEPLYKRREKQKLILLY